MGVEVVLFFSLNLSFLYIGAIEFVKTRTKPPTSWLKKLNQLVKTKYFTKLNIVVVFNKTKMIENEKWKTVFRIK